MRYKPEFADDARDFCRRGATDEELADYFAVCVRTIYRWRNMHEEFAEAVVTGKEHADARVERALYSRAVGCTVQRTRLFKHAGEDPVYASYLHHLPPDPVAALQWLRVRQPKKWGQQQEKESDPGPVERIQRAPARVAELRPAHPMPPPPVQLKPKPQSPSPAAAKPMTPPVPFLHRGRGDDG
jgi:hypothetical protein